MADFGVMMPFILGTELMMPLFDQKWLVPASRISSKAGPEKPCGPALGTGFAGTRPGAFRPGMAIWNAQRVTARGESAGRGRQRNRE
jgi:hypothetical protein